MQRKLTSIDLPKLASCLFQMVEIRDDNFAPPLPVLPHASFPHPTKAEGRGWGKILAPHYRAGMDLDFLDPPHPTPPRPHPAPRC